VAQQPASISVVPPVEKGIILQYCTYPPIFQAWFTPNILESLVMIKRFIVAKFAHFDPFSTEKDASKKIFTKSP